MPGILPFQYQMNDDSMSLRLEPGLRSVAIIVPRRNSLERRAPPFDVLRPLGMTYQLGSRGGRKSRRDKAKPVRRPRVPKAACLSEVCTREGCVQNTPLASGGLNKVKPAP